MFKPTVAPPIDNVRTTVGPLVLPPAMDYDRTTTTVTQDQPPAPPVIINPQPIYRGNLVYPDRAVEHDVSGYVDFTFIIEPDGYGFAASAKRAFPHWRFKPQLVDGKPVAAPARIRVTFKLN